MERRAKIIATLGPASQDKKTIKNLLKAGMDVARINFSHGTHQEHAQVIQNLRECARELNRSVTIMQDLSGPKIRTGEMTDGPVELIEGNQLVLTTEEILGTPEIIQVNFSDLPQSVNVDGRILLDDGRLELLVKAIKGQRVITEVIQGGPLKAHKGVNLPGANLKIQALTDKDLKDLEFGLSQDIDVIALSFVRKADDITPGYQSRKIQDPYHCKA